MSGAIDSTQAPQNVLAGDSTIMKPRLSFTEGGTALIRYYVLDVNNAYAIIDSVDINITSVMSVEDEQIEFSAYPNPASNDFYIQFEGHEGTNYSLVTFNVLGEEVLRTNLKNGTNQLSVSQLKNGVYFYSIMNKGEIIETKKLIVRH